MGVVSSLASVLGINETAAPVTAAIAELDPVTNLEVISPQSFPPKEGKNNKSSFQAFQYFPETITDTKAPEWVRNSVPGGSHPIVSFLNGGERILSFTAIFTQDDNPEPLGALQAALTGSFEFGLDDLFGGDQRKDVADIPAALAYLRKFTYPNYTTKGLSEAPPFTIVYLPNSGIIGQGNFPDSIVGAMLDCSITYEKFHRNGSPRIVAVNLSFIEVVQVGENWKFVGRSDIDNMLDAQGRKSYSREVIGAAPAGGLLDSLLGGLF